MAGQTTSLPAGWALPGWDAHGALGSRPAVGSHRAQTSLSQGLATPVPRPLWPPQWGTGGRRDSAPGAPGLHPFPRQGGSDPAGPAGGSPPAHTRPAPSWVGDRRDGPWGELGSSGEPLGHWVRKGWTWGLRFQPGSQVRGMGCSVGYGGPRHRAPPGGRQEENCPSLAASG